jgi:hypothetical protein
MKPFVAAAICSTLTLFCVSSSQGQTTNQTVTVNDPRPLAAASDKIEQLSGLPVNYEDGPYVNAADLQDVTSKVLTPSQIGAAGPNFRLIVPRGGQLSAVIAVDTTTGGLGTLNAAQAAAGAFVNTHASGYSQLFFAGEINGSVFITPAKLKNIAGSLQPITPVLSAYISFPQEQRTGYDTLKLILQLVLEATGSKVGIASAPFKAFAETNVTIGANNEDARTVLTRLLQAVTSGGGSGVSMNPPAMSYRLLYDYNLKLYELSIKILNGATVPFSSPQSPPSGQTPTSTSPYFIRVHP